MSRTATPTAVYESWDLTPPLLPPRSRLYWLEPIGVGTPMVESLAGYLARLAEAHCVTPWTLYKHEIAPLLQRRKFSNFCLAIPGNGHQHHTINGSGVLASEFTRALESLTRRKGLSHLTLLQWAAVLPKPGLLRRARAWCPDCLIAWRAAGTPVYEPLLWTLQLVTVCPRHQRPLSLICPSCKLQNGQLETRLWPGHCSRCLQWLAPANIAEEYALPNEWQIWVTNAFGELLETHSRVSSAPTVEPLKQALNSHLSPLNEVESGTLIDLLQVRLPCFESWRTGKSLPRLHNLLRICYTLDQSLLGFIGGQKPTAVVQIVRSAPELFPSEVNPPRRQPPYKSADFERALQNALEESPPVSVCQIFSRLGRKKNGKMWKRFPELITAVSTRYAEFRASDMAKRKDEAIAEVRRVAREMHDAGLPLRCRDIAARLTKSGLSRPEGRTALREIKEELGLE